MRATFEATFTNVKTELHSCYKVLLVFHRLTYKLVTMEYKGHDNSQIINKKSYFFPLSNTIINEDVIFQEKSVYSLVRIKS